MKRIASTAFAVALFATLGACKQEPAADAGTTADAPTGTGIDGNWTVDLASVKQEGKPFELTLKDGSYTCSTCIPALTVAADGQFHAVTGRDYADEMSVKIDSDTQVTVSSKKGGVAMGSTVDTISADGKTLTQESTDTSVPNAPAIVSKSTSTRVGDAPAGAHALSGKWQPASIQSVSKEGLSMTFATTADTLKMTSPDGTGYEAKLDGTDAPVSGDVANTMVSVTKPSDNVYQIVTKRDGKAVNTTTVTVDGDMLHTVSKNERNGNSTSYDAKRS